MVRTIFKIALSLVLGHLLFGWVLLIIDLVHGINDQDFSFALWLLFYYLNYSGVWLLRSIGVQVTLVRMILAGLPQWICLSPIIGIIVGLFKARKTSCGIPS